MDIANGGIPLSDTVAHDLEAVYFYCRTCHRSIAATPEDLLKLAPPETGIWTLTRRLRCTSCGERDFTVRLGYPKDCVGIGKKIPDHPAKDDPV
ncbi:hypothetical protein [Thalassospira alkalitolerans]|uniref:hypothetical protein n=1 Tax=Thalassospira alkalitolerans TaxID=1293890 RepID=UPI0030ED553E|tara:strand:+ start:27786 stop:28067 length:282 start_codon:yes stop_codon:yes gene_type:complete